MSKEEYLEKLGDFKSLLDESFDVDSFWDASKPRWWLDMMSLRSDLLKRINNLREMEK